METVAAVALVAFVVVVVIFVALVAKINKLKLQILQLKGRNPAEVDLELATSDQIMTELKKRPVRVMMIFPNFQIDDVLKNISLKNVAVEVVGIPPHVAVDIMKVTCEMFELGEGRYNPPREEE